MTSPAGKPLLPSPESLEKLTPLSVLRKMPPLPPPAGVNWFAAATIVAPRAATPEIVRPASDTAPGVGPAALPMDAQLAPPSTVLSNPTGGPPAPPKELELPVPATRVLLVASVGSRSSAPIDSEPSVSVSGVQTGSAEVAFVVFQTPPLTAPIHRVAGSTGWATTVCTAPTTGLLTGAGMPSI